MASSGNFATLLNGLLYQVGTNTTYSLGNLKYQSSTSGEYSLQASTLAPSSGKWYAEMYVNTVGNLNFLCLVGDVGVSDTTNRDAYPNRTSNGGMGYAQTGFVRFNNSDTSSGYSTYTTGDIIQIAFDIDNTKVWFGKNNTWQNSGDPANGTNASYTNWTTTYGTLPRHWHVAGNIGNTGANTFNFGGDSSFGGAKTSGSANASDSNSVGNFFYTPPNNFLALSSSNLPLSDDIDPAQTSDDIPQKQFDVTTWTGNSSSRTITTNMQPDLVWIKSRSNSNSNELYDSSRGATKRLRSDTADSEDTRSSELTGFTSDGFSLGSSTFGGTNYNSYTYVGWSWRAGGGVTSSNTDGSITSTVQANTKAGFSIITWTASGSNGSIGHGLSAKPDFHIIKKYNSSNGWIVYHTSLGATKFLRLDLSNASASNQYLYNNTEPTSTVINLGDNGGTNHPSGDTYICYAWHSVEGFSKFGTYVGNGNNSGIYIHLGFRAKLFFLKEISSSDDWVVYDTARDTFNSGSSKVLRWDSSNSEFDDSSRAVDVTSQGLKIRTSNATINGSGVTYIFGAWADQSGKYSNTF